MRNPLSRATVPLAATVLAAVAALPAAAATPLPVPEFRAAAPAAPAAPAADHPTYIVTVHPELDPGTVAEAYGITPIHVYRDALNGFAARLSPEQVEDLRATRSIVRSVEADGTASGSGIF
ncbi:protease inhibitor I9 family protein [Streptomyces antarcticus]|uniref:protease inhibitor I9 family protein n=1 Tax=Streptomyces antarcticus TaxID=2996458 RepID=UPI002271B630|nr:MULTISPECIES: protease inhibitor I9 family protein [unclassified Streptomyces]MCY0947421.1 protease inhibitor I9 family protein [Streptomyces sp. H34-AA3]MCY0953811.1 protease inhibitor I9 family protein [Streptomyces sp. H27-S2]MCZ4086977.1 protease inhibitor I9 family protein [Streptomyces sp. H34-S5]